MLARTGTPAAAQPAAPDEPATLLGSAIRSVVFSPDGKVLVAATGIPRERGRVAAWDVGTRHLLWIREEDDGVPIAAFAPDGKVVAIAIYDKTAKLLDAANGQVRATLCGHTMEVRSVAFAPDNKTLATGSWDQQVKLWSLPGGKLQRTLTGHADRVYSVAFSPDGRTLAVAGMGQAALWDVAKGAPTIPLKGHGGSTIGWIEFSRDGRWVITAGWDGQAKVWDGKTGVLRARFEGRGTLEQATLSPDGRLLAVCGRDSAVEVFQANLRRPNSAEQAKIARLIQELDDEAYPVRENAEKALTAMTYLADARLRQALKESKSAEVRIRVRRILAGMRSQPGKFLRGHNDALRTVGFAPDSKLLASGSMDGTIRLWDVESGKEVAVLRLPAGTRNPLR